MVVNLQQLQVQAIHAVLQQAAQSGGEGNQFFAEAGEDGNTISPEQQIALLQELMNVTTGKFLCFFLARKKSDSDYSR